MTAKKYYTVYLSKREEADKLSAYLKSHAHYYERSGCGSGFHFSVLLSPEEVEEVDNFLDTL